MSNYNIQEFLEKNKSLIGDSLVLLRCKNEDNEYISFSNLNNKPVLFGFIIEENNKGSLIPKFKSITNRTSPKKDSILFLLDELGDFFNKETHSILIDRINFFDLYV